MLLSDRVKGFFHHLTAEYAISLGWDFEEQLADFYSDKDLMVAAYSIRSSGKELTELDIFEASKGNATTSFKDFFIDLLAKSTHMSDETPLLVSMHSGSSDYLFVGEAKKMITPV